MRQFESMFLFLLFVTGAGAFVQCWFLLHFYNMKSRKNYYFIYIIVSYGMYIISVFSPIQIPLIFDCLIGVVVLYLFLNKILKRNYIESAIGATLTMAVTALVESIISIIRIFTFRTAAVSQIHLIIEWLVFPLICFMIFFLLVKRYSVRSHYQSKYLLAFSLPILFISVMLRTVNNTRYIMSSGGIALQPEEIHIIEVIFFTIIALPCILTILFAYEKTMKEIEGDYQKSMLHAQIEAQESYVAEARQKYEATKVFRHDFKNHMIALRGLMAAGDMEKATAYLERFDQTYQDITFPVQSGNCVLDILLGEKLSYAKQVGIQVKCDVCIPENIKLDDFDLCAIFANAIDNAIKACSSIKNGQKTIDIVAKANKNFFIIDMLNNYQIGSVVKGSGIGLGTIHIIAEKYCGAVEISDLENIFRISVILPFEDSFSVHAL